MLPKIVKIKLTPRNIDRSKSSLAPTSQLKMLMICGIQFHWWCQISKKEFLQKQLAALDEGDESALPEEEEEEITLVRSGLPPNLNASKAWLKIEQCSDEGESKLKASSERQFFQKSGTIPGSWSSLRSFLRGFFSIMIVPENSSSQRDSRFRSAGN